MGRKELMKDKALNHAETMDRLYCDEIKKSINETRLYGIDFHRKETAGKGAKFSLEQSLHRKVP